MSFVSAGKLQKSHRLYIKKLYVRKTQFTLERNLSVFIGTNKHLLGGTLLTLLLLLFSAYTVGKSQKLDVFTSFYLLILKS